MSMRAALWSEWLKVRRSRMPLATAAGALLMPVMASLFMLIQKHPEWADRLGIIATKAEMMTSAASWPAYLGVLLQAVAVGGFLLFGMIAVWTFGREYADRTVIDLLALPTARSTIVRAKFIVVAIWCAAMTAVIAGVGIALGMLIELPELSATLVRRSLLTMASTAGLMTLVVTPFALAASVGRGFMPGVGALLAALVLSQVIAAVGLGQWFPWSVPALHGGVPGGAAPPLGTASYLIVAFVGVAGLALTERWWTRADQR